MSAGEFQRAIETQRILPVLYADKQSIRFFLLTSLGWSKALATSDRSVFGGTFIFGSTDLGTVSGLGLSWNLTRVSLFSADGPRR